MQANAAVANAYVADISEPAERARRFGLLGAMFGMGFILGPVMGGILGHYDLHLPFFVAGGLAIVNWLYGYFVLPESLPESRRKPFSWKKANPVGAMKSLSNLPGGLRLILIIAASTLAQFTLHTTWVLYTGYRFNWTPLDTGLSLFAVGVASAVVQGGLIKHMLRWLGAPRLVQWGMFSSAGGYLLWGLATEGWMMYAVIAVNLLGFGVSSTFQSMVSGSVDERSQGATMGAVASLNSLMAVLAPLVGAPLMAAVSHLPAQDWRVGAPYFFCAAMQAVAAVLAVRWVREHRPLSEQAASLSSKKA
jgi:DHA1 family tetracycline resistance protein-like MFS transporter